MKVPALILCALSACAHRAPTAPAPIVAKVSPDVIFSSMGTVWTLKLGAAPGSVNVALIQESLQREALANERAFSDWSNDSELRRLERHGLTHPQHPSPVFMRGLLLAREACGLTEGTFDITVGAVLWKASTSAVGCRELVVDGLTFYFRRDPKRLTFGGIIKGAVVGSLAAQLYRAGLKNFLLSGGGGNLAVSGSHFGENWPTGTEAPTEGSIVFISRSKSQQGTHQHIFDPAQPARAIERQSEVVCQYPLQDSELWYRASGLTDALSKALIIKPEFNRIPQNCVVKIGAH